MSYFHRDCIEIASAARYDLDVFKNVGSLVLLSIRQPFIVMPMQMNDVWAKGRESKYLFGHKRAGYDFIQQHATRLQKAARTTYTSGDLDAYILTLLECPNLGVVKASFFAQMTVADGACLDQHNLARLGLPENTFKIPSTLKIETVHKKVRAYNAVWRAEGDSAFWWNSWCDFVASRKTDRAKDQWLTDFGSGDNVSRLHRLALGEKQEVRNIDL